MNDSIGVVFLIKSNNVDPIIIETWNGESLIHLMLNNYSILINFNNNNNLLVGNYLIFLNPANNFLTQLEKSKSESTDHESSKYEPVWNGFARVNILGCEGGCPLEDKGVHGPLKQ